MTLGKRMRVEFFLKASMSIVISILAISCTRAAKPVFVAPLYVEYLAASPEEFTKQARELQERLGAASEGVRVGFSTFLELRFRDAQVNTPIDQTAMQATLDDIDRIVDRARTNNLPVHISIASGFFHGKNALREAAIRADVRNAQWFSDGWIGDPQEFAEGTDVPLSAWATPSRYAHALRSRIEESARITGDEIASLMERFPDTLLNVSGDTEVELSFTRYLNSQGRARSDGKPLLADYSPFTIAEFRDWLRDRRYAGDLSPATDDNHDGHTLNGDFAQQFTTWQLRYFDNSGAIPLDQYRAMTDKLPQSGPYFIDRGFDAPRKMEPADAFWKAWEEFRVVLVANYVHDFARWMTRESHVPASRFFTHQIPADYLFDGTDKKRLESSASPLDTAIVDPLGSAGVTVFNVFNGKTHVKTSNTRMFRRLEQSSVGWGIVEYSPSVPATGDENYYLRELLTVYSYHPSIIAPFAWTTDPQHDRYRIQNTAFERALRKFIENAGSDFHR